MKTLRELAKPYYTSASHRWEHVKRVHSLAMSIGEAEGADLAILDPAAYFHDCKKDAQHEGTIKCHAEAGAEEVRTVLVGWCSAEDIDKIARCIAVHRFKQDMLANTLEEAVLQDADRLDRIGAMDIARDLAYCGMNGIPLYDPAVSEEKPTTALNRFYTKSLKLKPETFNTETARKLAEGRYQCTKEFVERFIQEWNEKL